MGTSAGGVIIRTSKGVDEISKFSFGGELIKSSYCDSRLSDCFYFARNEELIAIINSDFVNKIFNHNTIDEKLFNFLDNPDEIFAFEEYDSGASYGYAIFKSGHLLRKIRTENYADVVDEYGEPLKEEQEWLSGQRITDSKGETLIKNTIHGSEINDVFLYKEILQLLMLNRFSFTCETMDDVFTESGHYRMAQKANGYSERKGETNRKWWKFW